MMLTTIQVIDNTNAVMDMMYSSVVVDASTWIALTPLIIMSSKENK